MKKQTKKSVSKSQKKSSTQGNSKKVAKKKLIKKKVATRTARSIISQKRTLSRPTHIVGIGASAGGLDAIERFFDNMPSKTGLAYVVIQHLSPDFKSLMNELLSRHTDIEIQPVKEGLAVMANTVYLIPPRKNITIERGRFRLTQQKRKGNLNLPIDIFFESLAKDVNNKSIGVILSGTGSDGTRGIKYIHDAGGFVVVQDEESADFDGMPRSAAATGYAHAITRPDYIPGKILTRIHHPLSKNLDDLPIKEENEMSVIFSLIRNKYKIEFAQYKPNTITRRIERRVSLSRTANLEEYIKLLHDDPMELDYLYRDLLVDVTQFFRDPKPFDYFRKELVPQIFQNAGDTVRIWVPGCSTGEEAYTIAMILAEHVKNRRKKPEIKVFATDAHQHSLDAASSGIYNSMSIKNVPKEFLKNYFVKRGDKYQVIQKLRRMVIFAPHNVLRDPPFMKNDFISCRNLLIYFQNSAQRKVLTLFHFGLKSGGILFLGPSETVGSLSDEFDVLNRKWKIYKKNRDVKLHEAAINIKPPLKSTTLMNKNIEKKNQNIQKTINAYVTPEPYEQLLNRFVPPSLFIDDKFSLVHTFGDAGKFLAMPEGKVTSDILKLVHKDLRVVLSAGLHRASKEKKDVIYKDLKIQDGKQKKTVKLTIEPVINKRLKRTQFLISLEEIKRIRKAKQSIEIDLSGESAIRITDLEKELNYTKEHLQNTIEELETSNEELQSTNEELVASNEELQSTNEELHSVNEELYTVNSEYQEKIDELLELTNDVNNMLKSTEIGTIFLDRNFRIRKFTPAAADCVNLIDKDIGRLISDISSNIKYDDIIDDVKTVCNKEVLLEKRVSNKKGQHLLMRILPYRSELNFVDGVVIAFVDITSLYNTETELRKAKYNLERQVDMRTAELKEQKDLLDYWLDSSTDGVWDWDLLTDKEYYSPRFKEVLGYKDNELRNHASTWQKLIFPEDLEKALKAYEDHTKRGKPFNVPVRYKHKDGSTVHVICRGKAIKGKNGNFVRMVGSQQDITKLKEAEQAFVDVGQLLEKSLNEVYIFNQKSLKFLMVNEGALNNIGYSMKQMSNKTPVDIQPEITLNKFKNMVASLKSGKEEKLVFETVYKRKDRSCYDVEVHLQTGRYLGVDVFFAVALDITERKNNEAKIRESEQQFQKLYYEAPDMYVSVDPKSRIIKRCNQALLKKLGYKEKEVVGKDLFTMYHSDCHALVKAAFKQFLEKGEVKDKELILKKKNGDKVDVSLNVSSIKDAKGNILYSLSSWRDITESKKLTNQLKEIKERISLANESSKVGVWDWNVQTNELIWDQAMYDLYGIKESNFSGTYEDWEKAIHPDDVEKTAKSLQQCVKGKKPYDAEFRVIWPDKSIHYIRAHGGFKKNKRGKVERIVGTNWDITEIKKLTDELYRSNAELEQFAYVASHDLQEPLRKIISFSDLILQEAEGKLVGDVKGYFDRMQNATFRMRSLIDSLLELSRLTTNASPFKKVDLNSIFQEVVSNLEIGVKEKHAGIEIRNLPEIMGDAPQLVRLFQNLLNNSLKYAAQERVLHIKVYCKDVGSKINVFVEDNGIGFNQKYAEKIFIPFQRLHGKVEYKGGTGIGLTICQRIARRHGGGITAKSKLGKGSSFAVELHKDHKGK